MRRARRIGRPFPRYFPAPTLIRFCSLAARIGRMHLTAGVVSMNGRFKEDVDGVLRELFADNYNLLFHKHHASIQTQNAYRAVRRPL
jgi:hypothetical protein